MNMDTIKYNAAKRGLAKLCLNSLWGNMGERAQGPQTKLISEPKELNSFLASPDVQLSNMFADDVFVCVS
jgi:hypothetical protein